MLELEQSKWYVGFSRDTQTRIAAHFLGCGALWTQKYKPRRVMEVRPGDEHLENLVTVAMMCQHGWQNVRGGKYCAVDSMKQPPSCIQKALYFGKRKRETDAPVPKEEVCAHGSQRITTLLQSTVEEANAHGSQRITPSNASAAVNGGDAVAATQEGESSFAMIHLGEDSPVHTQRPHPNKDAAVDCIGAKLENIYRVQKPSNF